MLRNLVRPSSPRQAPAAPEVDTSTVYVMTDLNGTPHNLSTRALPNETPRPLTQEDLTVTINTAQREWNRNGRHEPLTTAITRDILALLNAHTATAHRGSPIPSKLPSTVSSRQQPTRASTTPTA